MIEMRHAIHREPELFNDEMEDPAADPRNSGKIGLTGAKTFTRPAFTSTSKAWPAGRSALHGDINVLPAQESRNNLSYCSEISCLMHADGMRMHRSLWASRARVPSHALLASNFGGHPLDAPPPKYPALRSADLELVGSHWLIVNKNGRS